MSEQTDIQALLDRFKRTVPPGKDYQDRLAEEFELVLNQRFTQYFLQVCDCLLYTSPSPRDLSTSRMPSSA